MNASTNQRTGLNGLLESIPWGSPSSRTVRAPMFQRMLDCQSMLTHQIDYFRSKPVNIPKITILLDYGYHPDHLKQEQELVYPPFMRSIKFERSTKPVNSREGSDRESLDLFQQSPGGGSERSNAWMERCKILVKNSEANPNECDD